MLFCISMQEATNPQAFELILRSIEWALVPLVLVLLLGYGFFILPEEPEDNAATRAARAARWAGCIILVLFVVSRKDRGDSLSLTIPSYDFSWTFSLGGAIGGFLLSWLVSKLREPRVFGVFVLGLVAGSSIALYSYFFIQPARSPIIFLALGFALGTLLDRTFTVLSAKPPENGNSKSGKA